MNAGVSPVIFLMAAVHNVCMLAGMSASESAGNSLLIFENSVRTAKGISIACDCSSRSGSSADFAKGSAVTIQSSEKLTGVET